ncbi:substrate-binding domain-containing protein [Lentibacillus sp. N15]|uniref:LacI family DNA-binding transcriptional regulator n=1 Tax=Lentibacillus songyuanensis TaxID=3136161 RepID=UPI0031BB7ADB
MKKVSITDVAKAADVSNSTVSQYLNKRFNYMSEGTKKRIEDAVEKLNYQPNYIARSLRQKKTSTIGVIVANILHTFSTQVIRSIEDYCHLHQFHVIVCNADDDPKKEKNYIKMLRAKQVDGLIVFPTGENLDLYKKLLDENYPLIFMDRLGPDGKGYSILLDNEKASSLAVQHLIDEGIKEIGIVTTLLSQHLTPRLERVKGYRKVLEENGLLVKDEYIIHTELKQIKNSIKKMFALPNPPKGLVAGNDLTLLEILELCREEGINLPRELALVGIDEVPFASAFNPMITTVAQPAFDMGSKAAKLLLQTINDEIKETGNVFRFEPKLIIRESSKQIQQ